MTIETRRRTSATSGLTQRKLAAFARIEADFAASFAFVQEMRGQRRFAHLTAAQVVGYLHALYTCERKDRLLSVRTTRDRYTGRRALELLREWQEGRVAEAIAFIHSDLDDQPFGELSRAIERATRAGETARAARLLSGRANLLNRNYNLSHALDALFAHSPERLRDIAREECKRLGHTPAAITRQLRETHSDLYAYAPSQELAQRNMLVMNRLVPVVMAARGDQPGERTDHVAPPTIPDPPYAEARIAGQRTQLSLDWRTLALPAAPGGAARAGATA